MTDKEDSLIKAIGSISEGQLDVMRKRFHDEIELSGALHVEAASKFQAGLDKVVDVLLILVLKFGRATTMLIVLGLLNVVCLVINVIATVQVASTRSEVRDLVERQEEFASSQKRIETSTTATQKTIDATQAKVDSVVEASPKIEVDAKTGKAKIIIPTKKSAPASSKPVELNLK